MIMLYAHPIDHPTVTQNQSVNVSAPWSDGAESWGDPSSWVRFDVTKRAVTSPLTIGESTYVLRSESVGSFVPGRGGVTGSFIVREFYPDYIGRGRTSEKAFLDWRDQIHRRFQELYAKRPFEMTSQEKKSWSLLEGQIDVATYRRETPLTVRQIGKVVRARPFPESIRWEDGRKEDVRLDQMPGEFAAFNPGQPFEAIVVRDAVDFSLLKVTYVRRVKSLPRLSDEEFSDLLRSIPTTSSLPDADWD